MKKYEGNVLGAKNEKTYLQGLNELRAIAALGVLVYHISQQLVYYGIKTNTELGMGPFGVTLFFALSGFLISYLLFLEKSKCGGINVRHFYIRRVLRIWPLYFFYIFIVIIVLYALKKPYEISYLKYWLLIIPNLVFPFKISVPLLYHYWSLGVEENFYLFWPLFVKRGRNLIKRFIQLLTALLLLRVILKLLSVITHNNQLYEFSIYNRIDCMIIGAIGAYTYYFNVSSILSIINNIYCQVFAYLIIFVIFFTSYNVPTFISHDIFSIATVVIIINTIGNEKPLINIKSKFLDYLGTISFGLYIWHPLVVFLLGKYLGPVVLKMSITGFLTTTVVYIINILITILISFLSYNYFETYFLKIKEKFSKTGNKFSLK